MIRIMLGIGIWIAVSYIRAAGLLCIPIAIMVIAIIGDVVMAIIGAATDHGTFCVTMTSFAMMLGTIAYQQFVIQRQRAIVVKMAEGRMYAADDWINRMRKDHLI